MHCLKKFRCRLHYRGGRGASLKRNPTLHILLFHDRLGFIYKVNKLQDSQNQNSFDELKSEILRFIIALKELRTMKNFLAYFEKLWSNKLQ